MQQGSTPPNLQNRFLHPRRFVFLLGLTLAWLMPVVELQPKSVEALEVRASSASTGNSWQGASFPVENFQGYSSAFGYRRSPSGSAGLEFHRGLDIAAPEGSYIRNWWGGKVVKVSQDRLCGTSITVESGAWRHVYCHMKGSVETANGGRYFIDRSGGIVVWEGQQVAAGVRIGRVGMTGRTTGPHLHWGLKYGDNYVDPAQVLKAMYAQQPNNVQQARRWLQPSRSQNRSQTLWGNQGRRTIDY